MEKFKYAFPHLCKWIFSTRKEILRYQICLQRLPYCQNSIFLYNHLNLRPSKMPSEMLCSTYIKSMQMCRSSICHRLSLILTIITNKTLKLPKTLLSQNLCLQNKYDSTCQTAVHSWSFTEYVHLPT